MFGLIWHGAWVACWNMCWGPPLRVSSGALNLCFVILVDPKTWVFVVPPKTSTIPKKGAQFWNVLDIFAMKAFEVGQVGKSILTPLNSTDRGGAAEEAVQKIAEHIRRKENCPEGCTRVLGEG